MGWIPNSDHLERLIRELNLDQGNSVSTPLTPQILSMINTAPMTDDDASQFRSLAARVNYVAQDRPDLALVSTIAAAKMAAADVSAGVAPARLQICQGERVVSLGPSCQLCAVLSAQLAQGGQTMRK